MANPWEEDWSGTQAAPWEGNYNVVETKKPATPAAPLTERLGRQLGLTGRYILEGGLAPLDLAQIPVRGAMNLALPKDKQLQPVSAGGYISDVLNLPQPQNANERVVGDISRAMALKQHDRYDLIGHAYRYAFLYIRLLYDV